jgi:hypothetical protein
VDVPIIWCDVEIACQDHSWIDRACVRDPPGESIQPFELVNVLVAADRLPVGDVRADDADSADCGSKEALLSVRVQRVAVDDIGWAFLRQQGHAVVGLLSGKNDVIARSLDFLRREMRIIELRFLQTNDVRLRCRDPGKQLREANLERVDVPGSDFHR